MVEKTSSSHVPMLEKAASAACRLNHFQNKWMRDQLDRYTCILHSNSKIPKGKQQQGTAVFIDGLTIVWISNETIATASAAVVEAVSPVTLA